MMRVLITQALLDFITSNAFAQANTDKKAFTIKKQAEVNLARETKDQQPFQAGIEMPRQGQDKNGGAEKKSLTFKKQAEVDLSGNGPDFMPGLLLREMPRQEEG